MALFRCSYDKRCHRILYWAQLSAAACSNSAAFLAMPSFCVGRSAEEPCVFSRSARGQPAQRGRGQTRCTLCDVDRLAQHCAGGSRQQWRRRVSGPRLRSWFAPRVGQRRQLESPTSMLLRTRISAFPCRYERRSKRHGVDSADIAVFVHGRVAHAGNLAAMLLWTGAEQRCCARRSLETAHLQSQRAFSGMSRRFGMVSEHLDRRCPSSHVAAVVLAQAFTVSRFDGVIAATLGQAFTVTRFDARRRQHLVANSSCLPPTRSSQYRGQRPPCGSALP
jgi:hypothetical protein